ncbi:uncharacterized protein LY89DRAFT_15370 [Mollisia scopiformis]|uniref:Uncharacterized protein n=1 Tax=Mollisia scopiformis TaxID=149040 RepID=A0A194XV65_MOLSC|nr:uncharacterized protein LY89DRAFT_15370 [Mollisia scopiformis]KUJ24220.1 hypothetical protein LY89DRAFT_15370 [Mollisia scopiformis]
MYLDRHLWPTNRLQVVRLRKTIDSIIALSIVFSGIHSHPVSTLVLAVTSLEPAPGHPHFFVLFGIFTLFA